MNATTHYQRLGGEPVVRRLVETFYARMEGSPEAAAVRGMHPADLSQAKEKLFMFLSGWLGGPQLYAERFGHPRLRAIHLPFPIGAAERDAWMACMRAALEDLQVEATLRSELETAFARTADFMRNRPET